MIARNYRRYPEALALQLALPLACVVVRKIRERHTPGPAARVHQPLQAKDVEDVPIGSIVETPTGKRARVLGYRGYRRDHRVRLWCQYLQPENKRYDKVLLVPELVKVIEMGEG